MSRRSDLSPAGLGLARRSRGRQQPWRRPGQPLGKRIAAWTSIGVTAVLVLAVLTAYIRELGRALGHPADFSGPGAKPQRMAILTLAALIAAAEPLWHWRGQSLAWSLALIVALAAVTAARRTLTLAARLRAAAGA